MACWDIVGKAHGEPVYELLGGRVHDRLRTYTYLYPDAATTAADVYQDTAVYTDPSVAAERAAEEVEPGLHRREVRPGRALHGLRRPHAAAGGHRSQRAVLRGDPRGGRHEGRPAVRHPRPVHRGRRDPSRPGARAVRPAVVRGADAAGERRGDGPGRPPDVDPDRHRRAAHDQVRVRPGARGPGRGDPADGPRPLRRASSRPRRSPPSPRPTTPRSPRTSTAGRSRRWPTSSSPPARPTS